MKKVLCRCMAGLVLAGVLCSCSSSGGTGSGTEKAGGKKVRISFMANVTGGKDCALENAVIGFEASTGYQVDFFSPRANYENIMKTNMASGDMPDVFTTHGWSLNRYKDYLMPINSLPFARDISEQIRPAITDKDGNMYVLPIDIDISGLIYNADVLRKAGIDADSIRTWQDFTESCGGIRRKGYIPIQLCATNHKAVGQLFDRVASSFFITDLRHNFRAELKSGQFNAGQWEKIAGLIDSWKTSGYFNPDTLTADYDSNVANLAAGRSAFAFFDNSVIVAAKQANANCNLGMMPIPSAAGEDAPTLVADESMAVGIWKGSANKDAAVALLNYLARPEVMGSIATSEGKPAGLNGVKSNMGTTEMYYEKYRNVPAFPYFDRAYLPTGLWDVMCSAGLEILSGQRDAIEGTAQTMEKNFKDKFYLPK